MYRSRLAAVWTNSGSRSQESVNRLGQAAAGIAVNEIAPGRTAAARGQGERCIHFPEFVALEMPEGVLRDAALSAWGPKSP